VGVSSVQQTRIEGADMETEREIIRKVGEMMFGSLANELAEREFDVLLDLWRKYKADMERDAA
jgi:hypothetical protein